jgi:hypothetical protein
MARTLVLAVAGLGLLALPALATPLTRTADMGLNFNQTSYSDSWTGGDTGALAWVLAANLVFEDSLSVPLNWRNTVKLSFGQTHTQSEDDAGKLRWQKPKKSSDRIFAESLLRLKTGGLVDPFAAVTFESQFFDASVAALPRYVNPMLISQAAGVGRRFAKAVRGELYSRMGLALRENVHRDTLSVTPPRTEINSETDGGLDWTTDFSRTFKDKQMKYVSKLRVFKALFNSKSDERKGLPNQDDWKAPDVAWENTFSASLTKYIQMQLFMELLYDKEIDRRGRFREVLGLGLSYKLL